MNRDYVELLDALLDAPKLLNERTGQKTSSLLHQQFSHNMCNGLPIITLRKIRPKISAAEVAWYLMGTQSTEWLKRHTKIWENFEDEPGKVNSAYGFRMRSGIDQIAEALKKLTSDRSSRQCHITIWDKTDWIAKLKNKPCITGITLSALPSVGGNVTTLNALIQMRSSDVVVGLPYDMMTMAMLLQAMSCSLGFAPGWLTFSLANAHIYEAHRDAALVMIDRYNKNKSDAEYKLPLNTIEDIETNPDAYVSFFNTPPCDYDPKLEVFL